MTTKEFLIKVKEKIEKPENWIKGSYAKTTEGINTLYEDSGACKFCLSGAVYNVGYSFDKGGAKYLTHNIQNLLNYLAGGSMIVFNDIGSTTHADVMELLDKAIEAAE